MPSGVFHFTEEKENLSRTVSETESIIRSLSYMKNQIKTVFILFLWSALAMAGQPSSEKIQYLFPKDKSDWVVKESPIIVRFEKIRPDQISNLETFIHIRGDQSGTVLGKTVVSDDEKTLIFKPDQPYQLGEKITVNLTPHLLGQSEPFLDSTITFTIAPMESNVSLKKRQSDSIVLSNQSSGKKYTPNADGVVVLNGVSVPSDFPYIDITVNDNPDSDYIFTNYEGEKYYNLILDNNGNPVFYWIVPDSRRDFKVQETGVITMTVRSGFGGGGYIAVDNTFTVVDTFFVPPGYTIDEHELLVLPNGHYLVTAMTERQVDMRQYVSGGNPNATVIDYHLIEMDSNDNSYFIWRSDDPGNYEITDTDERSVNLRGQTIDYLHTNSIAVDLDGNYLITPKIMNEVTKINKTTGDIMWRLGGKKNQFDYIDLDGFVYMQHCIRVLPNGNYLIFDNGNYHTPQPYSRALEFKVDTVNMTATKVWEFRNTTNDYYAPYKGNIQQLPNGNRLINWGLEDLPKLTEVRLDKSKAFEMNFVQPIQCYRVWKCPWNGMVLFPFLVAESYTDRIALLFNKFGDPDVKVYRGYGGPDPNPTTILRTTSDPYAVLDENDITESNTYYFRVTAVDSDDNESAFSNEEMVNTTFIPVNTNMIKNNDFSSGMSNWNFNVQNSASASANASNNECHIQIQQGGTDFNDIELSQNTLMFYHGQTYVFEFDARADHTRIIDARIESTTPPYTNFGQIEPSYIQTTSERHSFTFEMENVTTNQTRVVFSVGSEAGDVYIDNVVLMRTDQTEVPPEPSTSHPKEFILDPIYPNPLNPDATISFALPTRSQVTLEIIDILGRTVKTVVHEILAPGHYTHRFHANQLSSGVYFCRIKANPLPSGTEFHQVRRMVILK